MLVKVFKKVFCQEVVFIGDDVDLLKILVQCCWFGDVVFLVIWGLSVIKGLYKKCQNLGIYCQQVIGKNKFIMCWLLYCGGVFDF